MPIAGLSGLTSMARNDAKFLAPLLYYKVKEVVDNGLPSSFLIGAVESVVRKFVAENHISSYDFDRYKYAIYGFLAGKINNIEVVTRIMPNGFQVKALRADPAAFNCF